MTRSGLRMYGSLLIIPFFDEVRAVIPFLVETINGSSYSRTKSFRIFFILEIKTAFEVFLDFFFRFNC